MSTINLITPPDKLYNQAGSILLVYPTEAIKLELHNFFNKNRTSDTNIYIYSINNDEHQFEWLLDVHKFCDLCIIDLDNLSIDLKCIESYLISFSKTYWLSQGTNLLYNKLSQNKIYNLDFLENKLQIYV